MEPDGRRGGARWRQLREDDSRDPKTTKCLNLINKKSDNGNNMGEVEWQLKPDGAKDQLMDCGRSK